MPDQNQQQQQTTNVKSTTARQLVVRVNPTPLDENHSFSKLVRQPVDRLNILLEQIKEDDTLNKISKVKQFESALEAALLANLQQEVTYATPIQMIPNELAANLRAIIREMLVIEEEMWGDIMKDFNISETGTQEDVDKIIKKILDFLAITNSFSLAINKISISMVNLYNLNLPPDRASRLANGFLTGYELWKTS